MSAQFEVPAHELKAYELEHGKYWSCEGAGVVGWGDTEEQARANWLDALRECRRAAGGLEVAR